MKKCVECRITIQESVPFSVCCGGKVGNTDKGKQDNLQSGEGGGAAAAAATATAAATASAAGGPEAAVNVKVMNNGNRDTSSADVQRLQEQLNDIKEQVFVEKKSALFLTTYFDS